MDAKKLCAAAVRFYALMLLIGSLMAAPQVLLIDFSDAPSDGFFVGSLLSAAVSLAAAAFLLLRTKTVVRWVAPDLEPGAEVEPPRGSELGVLAFSLAGLVFVVRGLYRLCHGGAVRAEEWMTSYDKASIAASLLMIAIGLWLMFGSKAILRAVQRLQRPPIADDPP